MADMLSKRGRSMVMAAIRSKGNKATELKLVHILRQAKIRGWRRHQRIAGNPDFVFKREKLAVFVDGCFWHGCKSHCRMPKSNAAFWRKKISRNRARDREVSSMLRQANWRVLRIWEHSLTKAPEVEKRLARRLNASRKVR